MTELWISYMVACMPIYMTLGVLINQLNQKFHQLLCAHHCTTSFCVCLDWPKVCTCAHQCTTSVCVCLEGPIWFVLTNAPLLSGGAQICFLCSLMHHVFLCLPGGSQPVLCSIMHHVSICLSGLAQVCFCAHSCTTSCSENPKYALLCSLMHHVFLCLS